MATYVPRGHRLAPIGSDIDSKESINGSYGPKPTLNATIYDQEAASIPEYVSIQPNDIYGNLQYDGPINGTQLHPIEELEDENRSMITSLRSRASVRTAQKISSLSDPSSPDASDDGDNTLSLEKRYEILFSREHLQAILTDHALSADFEKFLAFYRPRSMPMIRYYRDVTKVLKSMRYAQAMAERFDPVDDYAFTHDTVSTSLGFTWILQDKVDRALDVLINDMPAFISYTYMRVMNAALAQKCGQNQDFEFAPEGLAEVFVLSDPTKNDNPIVFSSEEFHLMTGYSRKDFLGHNCRLLGGRDTSVLGIRRLKAAIEAQEEHCETLLNYHKHGAPFINLVMCVPLRDQRGALRYYLGAQLDITSFFDNHSLLSSLRELIEDEYNLTGKTSDDHSSPSNAPHLKEFEELIESFDKDELDHLVLYERRKALLPEGIFLKHDRPLEDLRQSESMYTAGVTNQIMNRAFGFYPKYLLVRPHPSLRVLFASSEFELPTVLQKPLLTLVDGNAEVLEDLTAALVVGRKVTARVNFKYSPDVKARPMWLHCTPLFDVDAAISVWVVILVETEAMTPNGTGKELEDDTSGSSTSEEHTRRAAPWKAQEVHKKSLSSSSNVPSTSESPTNTDLKESKRSMDENGGLLEERPRRRTYKSLSPYGILFE